MNKRGQANLFFYLLMGAGAIIFFVLAFPLLNEIVITAAAGTTNIFVRYMIRIIPYFLFIMIIWGIIYMAKNAGGAEQ